jgi:hypothetical protein
VQLTLQLVWRLALQFALLLVILASFRRRCARYVTGIDRTMIITITIDILTASAAAPTLFKCLSLSAAAKEDEYSVNESIESNDMDVDNNSISNNDDDHNEHSMLEEVDVCIKGSGLGGLCVAAILNILYDKTVAVYESHDVASGCARRSKSGVAVTFYSGQTILLGCSSPPFNALQQVLQAIGQDKAVE